MSYWQKVKTAFRKPINVWLFGFAFPASWLLALWSSNPEMNLAPLFVLGSEAFYLLISAVSLEEKESMGKNSEALGSQQRLDRLQLLSGLERQRYLRLEHLVEEIQRKIADFKDPLLEGEQQRIQGILNSAFKVYQALSESRRYLLSEEPELLVEKIQQVQERLEKASDPEARSLLQQAYELHQKRLREYQRIEKMVDQLEAQSEAIESSLLLISQKLSTWGFAHLRPQLSADLDVLLENLQIAERVSDSLGQVSLPASPETLSRGTNV